MVGRERQQDCRGEPMTFRGEGPLPVLGAAVSWLTTGQGWGSSAHMLHPLPLPANPRQPRPDQALREVPSPASPLLHEVLPHPLTWLKRWDSTVSGKVLVRPESCGPTEASVRAASPAPGQAPPREWTGPGHPEARRVPWPLRLHRVHLCWAPALDLAGPQCRAVVDAATGEDPCEGGAAFAGCTPGSSPRPSLRIREVPQHTQGPRRRRERPGQGGGPGAPCSSDSSLLASPALDRQTEGTTHPSHVPSPFTVGSFLPPSLGCLCASCLEHPSRNLACQILPVLQGPSQMSLPLGSHSGPPARN